MKSFLKVFSNEWIIVFLSSSILILISLIPYFHQVKMTPPDKVFLGVHNNLLDYPMYIADIKQAKAGRVTFYVQYTSEDQKPTFVHFPYLFLGTIGRIGNMDDIALYHVGRVLFGLLLSCSYYYFICQVFKDKKMRLGAFFLTLFSGGLIKYGLNSEGVREAGTYLSWWTGGDTIRRATFQPHGMFKTVLFIFSLSFIGKYIRGDGKKYYFLAVCLVPLLGLLDPVGVAGVMFLIWGYLGYKTIRWIIKKESVSNIFVKLLPFLAYSVAFLPFLIYMNWVFRETPWVSIKEVEKGWYNQVVFAEYAGQFGITLFAGLLGIPFFIKKVKGVFGWMCLGLIIPVMVLILTRVGYILGFYNLRFFGFPLQLFMAILSVSLFYQIGLWIAKVMKKGLGKARNYMLVIVLVVIAFSVPTYFVSLRIQKEEFKTEYFNLYPSKSFWKTGMWMEENIPYDKAVLSNTLAGGIIPAVSGNRVYIGHIVSTLNYVEKEGLMNTFFAGEMNEDTAYQFIKNGNIEYVLCLWGEKAIIASKNYSFLKMVYNDSYEATIYRVIK